MLYRARFIFILVLISISLSSCAPVFKTVNQVEKPAPILNEISGREGVNGPVLVVKIDDTVAAHPQIGLEDADLVYIEEVEGGLTRLAAIFSSRIPTRIGPVRSARISDIELLAQYGRIAFAYSGAQKKLWPVIAAANLQNLGAQAESPIIYTTDPNRRQPFAMVLRADLLMQKVADRGYQIAQSKNMGWQFGKAPVGGTPISSVKVSWPATSYIATWSKAEKRWHLSHQGNLKMAESGKVLGATTLVIQNVLITPSIYYDKGGGVTPFSATIGSGSGYILRDGRSFKAKWSRISPADGTHWTLEDGSKINFSAGQIWVALTDQPPEFTLPTPSTRTPPTK